MTGSEVKELFGKGYQKNWTAYGSFAKVAVRQNSRATSFVICLSNGVLTVLGHPNANGSQKAVAVVSLNGSIVRGEKFLASLTHR